MKVKQLLFMDDMILYIESHKDANNKLKVCLLISYATATAAKSLQSCLTLCDPIPGILQARTLEWVAISFSNA